jgi:cell division transport system permease protein
MHFNFFLREAVRAMRRNAAPSFAALATVLVTMLVLGVFIPIVQAAQGEAGKVRKRVYVEVFMKTTATPSQEARVRTELLAIPHVKSVSFLSKQQALTQQMKQNPQGFSLLAANPLPDTFHVYSDAPNDVLAVRSALQPKGPTGQVRMIDPAIQNLSGYERQTRKILKITSGVTIAAIAVTALLILASVLLIANTIRLSLFARRREVEVMKLVGATDWFIRWPFVIEGVVVGALGALAAIGVLGLAKVLLLDPILGDWTLVAALHTIAFPLLLAVLLVAGVVVSALGSGLSLRRFLRV